MKIPAIINFSHPYRKLPSSTAHTSFGTNESSYYDEEAAFVGNEIKRNTYFLRGDIFWQGLADYMNLHFKDKEKVNVYSLAASDGSEAYSLALILIERLGYEKAKKFFPIKASDKDREIIEAANRGTINLRDIDINRINDVCDFKKYFEEVKEKSSIYGDNLNLETKTYRVKEPLKSAVEFKHSTLQYELDKIEDDGNSVVLCRNVMRYLNNNDDIMNIARMSARTLKKGSFFIIGDADKSYPIKNYLNNVGFTDFDYNIFKKIKDLKLNKPPVIMERTGEKNARYRY